MLESLTRLCNSKIQCQQTHGGRLEQDTVARKMKAASSLFFIGSVFSTVSGFRRDGKKEVLDKAN